MSEQADVKLVNSDTRKAHENCCADMVITAGNQQLTYAANLLHLAGSRQAITREEGGKKQTQTLRENMIGCQSWEQCSY